ncbi:MAG: YbjN domain-containing protein [Lachnospiraceae bacterium]|nr:YbjN domain-containing protein [Lachnospiraceae bacterium]
MTGDKNMNISDSISRWAESSGLEAKVIEGSILFPVENGDVSWIARVTALEEDGMVYIVTAYPFDVTEEKRVDVMKKINEINIQLKMGTFYIDNDDGQVNFRLGQWVTDGESRDRWVSELIFIAMNVTGTYYKMFMDMAE